VVAGGRAALLLSRIRRHRTEVRGEAMAEETVARSFPVEAGQILYFARALGDPNPIYADAEYAAGSEVGGVLAPPTFTELHHQHMEEYPLRPKLDEPWFGSGREATGRAPRAPAEGGERRSSSSSGGGGGGTGLHAEQHFEYHAPILAGDVLSWERRRGESWEREGRRGGTLRFREAITEFRNQRGELVVTARAITVRTERPVDQG
jgi:acyl dehydratase